MAVASPTGKANYFGRTVVVLPTFQVSASTNSTADLKVSLEVRRGLGRYANTIDFVFQPIFATSTKDGIGSLFQFSDNKNGIESPWWIGANLALTQISSVYSSVKVSEATKRAFETCKAHCSASPVDDQKKFCDLAFPPGKAPLGPRDLDVTEFCKDGRDLIDAERKKKEAMENERSVARMRLFPIQEFSIGGRAGATQLDFLNPSSTDPTLFTENKPLAPTGSAAASYTWVQPSAATSHTVEAYAFYDYRSDPQTTKGHWCVPAGNATRPNATPGVIDPIQTCKDLSLGTPDKNSQVSAAILWGMVDKDTPSFWRASMGPYASWTSTSNVVRFGIEAPLYLNFLALGIKDPNYQGILRLIPTIGARHEDSKGWSADVVLTIEVMGKSNLFLRALDWIRP